MKSKWLLIPGMVAVTATPFIGLTSCKDKEPDDPEPTPPEPEYVSIPMTLSDSSYVSETRNFEKNQYYRFWFNNSFFSNEKVNFNLSNSYEMAVAGSWDVFVYVNGEHVEFAKLSDFLYVTFNIVSTGSNVEIYWKAVEPIKNATAVCSKQ